MVQLIAEDGFYETIEPAVNRVKNKKFNGFIYGLEPHFHVGIGSSKTPFLDFVKTLETKEFVDAAHSSIDKHVNYIKKQTYSDRETFYLSLTSVIDSATNIKNKMQQICNKIRF